MSKLGRATADWGAAANPRQFGRAVDDTVPTQAGVKGILNKVFRGQRSAETTAGQKGFYRSQEAGRTSFEDRAAARMAAEDNLKTAQKRQADARKAAEDNLKTAQKRQADARKAAEDQKLADKAKKEADRINKRLGDMDSTNPVKRTLAKTAEWRDRNPWKAGGLTLGAVAATYGAPKLFDKTEGAPNSAPPSNAVTPPSDATRTPEDVARAVQQRQGKHGEPSFSYVGGNSKADKIRDTREAKNALGARLRMADQQGQMDLLRARTVAGMRGELPGSIYNDPRYAGAVDNAAAAREAYNSFMAGNAGGSGRGSVGSAGASATAKQADEANAKVAAANEAFQTRVRGLLPPDTDPRAVAMVMQNGGINALNGNPEAVLQLIRAQAHINANYKPNKGYGFPDVMQPGVLAAMNNGYYDKKNVASILNGTGADDPTKAYQRAISRVWGDTLHPYNVGGNRGYLVGDTGVDESLGVPRGTLGQLVDRVNSPQTLDGMYN
jgi:hypothetical protein